TKRTRTRRRPLPLRTTEPIEIERNAVATNFSWHSRFSAQNESDAAHGLYQFDVFPVVEFPAQMREVNVDHIIKRCRAIGFSPNLTRNHLPRHRFIMMLREEREQIEFAWRKCNLPRSTHDVTRLHIQCEIADLVPQRVSKISSPQQSANARKQ